MNPLKRGVLRDDVQRELKRIGEADMLVGIPALDNENTIMHVVKTAGRGLKDYFPDARSVIVVSDNGSVDDTRELAALAPVPKEIRKIISIYRGMRGKGTAFRAIFEIAKRLKVRACVVVDSDLRSITPEWIRILGESVLDGYGYVAPLYKRHKYDGTITNNIAYPLTRALYGLRIRQPIGGDFAFCSELAQFYAENEVWLPTPRKGEEEIGAAVAQFGIDVWMTTCAVNEGFKVCQADLGVKIHDPKDPGSSLGPMFRQVVGALFGLMGSYRGNWQSVKRSRGVPVVRGRIKRELPPPVHVSYDKLVYKFQSGYRSFREMWRSVLMQDTFEKLEKIASMYTDVLCFPPELWVKVIYDYAVHFNKGRTDRLTLLDSLTPLYFGRVASFVAQTKHMSEAKAERLIGDQADVYEQLKPYLLDRWG
jgi:glycosyltransferase involved in cell wall biosynthesis